jgi:hypothetical protein
MHDIENLITSTKKRINGPGWPMHGKRRIALG